MDVWDKIFKSQRWGEYPENELIRFIARNFYKYPNRSKIKILDIGCGTGANTWYIAREGFDTYGIDKSRVAINILKDRFKKEKLRCSTYVDSAINLPFENNFFDGVIEVECLTHNTFSDIQKIINEIYRVLKVDGKFYSQFFGKETWGFGRGRKIENGTYTGISKGGFSYIIHFTDRDELKLLFNKFDIVIGQIDRTENNHNNVREYIIMGNKS